MGCELLKMVIYVKDRICMSLFYDGIDYLADMLEESKKSQEHNEIITRPCTEYSKGEALRREVQEKTKECLT